MNKFKFIQISPEELKTTIAEVITCELPRIIKLHLQVETTKEFLSREEVAKTLGISLSGLHNWINQGILKPKKIGGKTYFMYSDIRAILDNQVK
jgi:predicted DNA-binding transcriptional regulator AlpA